MVSWSVPVCQVTFQGQVIGAILARSQRIAQRAAKLVEIEYEELESVITIKVRHNSHQGGNLYYNELKREH